MSNLSLLRPLILWQAAFFACMSASSVALAHAIATPPTPPEMDRRSSRFILPEHQRAYIETMTGRLSMSGRKIDPFGGGEEDRKPEPLVHPAPKIPLQQALAHFKIDAIFPQENRFVAFGRHYHGDARIPVKSRGRMYHLEVLAIHPGHIHFRDSETGEKATVQMKMVAPELPHGVIAR